ncbi:MAG: zinc-dependent metalloprotease [Ilumatobacteraceae bacterium]|nr:zinc-dependent metalloprotease [Ilumatobacteraceae bacterium]
MPAARSPIDWRRAEQIATSIAGRHPDLGGAAFVDFEHMIPQLEDQIEATTGLRSLAGPAVVQVIDRPDWIRANIASFQHLLAPVLDEWSAKMPSNGLAANISSQLVGGELGALLGWMSTRVLGQYDLLVGRDDDDAVYMVGPNLAAMERRFGFDPGEFRTWVLLHELTHRAQFTGVPWMKAHFTDLVDVSVRMANPDPHRIAEAIREAFNDRDRARQQVRDSGVFGLIASAEQRDVIQQIAGLMSLLEGHGDVTMSRAAGDLVSSAGRFSAVLQARRRRTNPLTRLMLRLTGIEGKLNQYAAGERFIAAIEGERGSRAVDVCWQSEANLPSMEEIRNPRRWLDRMGALVG